MLIVRRVRLLLAATSLLALTLSASAFAKPVKPDAGTVYAALYDGLKLVADGKFDGFIDKFCSKDKLCPTDQAIGSLKKYNLPAAQRQAPKCLKGANLEVTKVEGDPEKDDNLKIFIQCDERGMPRHYQMVKEGGARKFKNIY